jgi:hypothetical protein
MLIKEYILWSQIFHELILNIEFTTKNIQKLTLVHQNIFSHFKVRWFDEFIIVEGKVGHISLAFDNHVAVDALSDKQTIFVTVKIDHKSV